MFWDIIRRPTGPVQWCRFCSTMAEEDKTIKVGCFVQQIVVEGISKQFMVSERPEGSASLLRRLVARPRRTIQALDAIGFTMESGELVGYIGPNGAGKSTTVKIMSGILTPDAGRCEILGRTPWKQRTAHVAAIGVVFGQRSQLWWDVPVQDSFDLLKEIYRVPGPEFRARSQQLVDALQIGDLLRSPVRQLSLGQRMRCEMAAALLHSPKILFLDEPTIGLDTVSKLALRDFLREENLRRGVTIILTTHDMDDIEALCQRVMVIGHGTLLYDGALTTLKEQYSPLRCIRVVLEHEVEPNGIQGAARIDVDGPVWHVYYDPLDVPAPALMAQLTSALPLKDVSMEDHDIDAIIARMYQEMSL